MTEQVPAGALLDAWTADGWTNGLQVEKLHELETFSFETQNHTYEITVIDPDTREVLVRGGDLFPDRTPARLSGATLGGAFLKIGGIYIGFNIELMAGGRVITTSRVKKISCAR